MAKATDAYQMGYEQGRIDQREATQREQRAAAEGYDSPEETHRRLVRLLEWVTGTLAAGTDQPYTEDLEHIQERLTNIIRDMPANRTRQGGAA